MKTAREILDECKERVRKEQKEFKEKIFVEMTQDEYDVVSEWCAHTTTLVHPASANTTKSYLFGYEIRIVGGGK